MKKKNSTDDIKIKEIPIEEKKQRKRKPRQQAKAPQKKAVNEQPSDRKTRNRELVRVSYLIVFMFFSLVGYLVYFNVDQKDDINANSYNTKQDSYQEKIIRGTIYSADGEKLAGTNVEDDGTEVRLYPYKNVFSHVVGYASNGKSGVEATNNYDLLSCNASIFEQIKNEQQDVKVRGDSVVLTLDSRLQQACYDALGAYDGVVVVVEPSTGKILAMVSKPDFNPNTISEDWENLINDTQNSSLFNRATQGQYPPGSTFKVLTTLAYIRENPETYQNYTFDCSGSISTSSIAQSEENVKITCYNGSVHGHENLEQAFASSCNAAFASIGIELDNQKYKDLCESFLFNNDLPIAMPSSQSLFLLNKNASYGEEMMTAIGQGDTVVSPLEMALVTATVANGGNMMTPYYVDHLETYDGDMVKQYRPSRYKELMTTEEAQILTDYMVSTVENGTASALSGQSYTVAGKTGSAEYEIGGEVAGTHSWFVGFSDVESPDIAIAVIAENGGSGSTTAVPIAKQVFDAYYSYDHN